MRDVDQGLPADGYGREGGESLEAVPSEIKHPSRLGEDRVGDAEPRSSQRRHRRLEFQQSTTMSFDDDAEQPLHRKTERSCDGSSPFLVEKNQNPRQEGERVGDRRRLAGIEGFRRRQDLLHFDHFHEIWKLRRKRIAQLNRSAGMDAFAENLARDVDPPENRAEQIGPAQAGQVAELPRCRRQPSPGNGVKLRGERLRIVVGPHSEGGEEFLSFPAGRQVEQLPDLSKGERAATIAFEGEPFHRRIGEIGNTAPQCLQQGRSDGKVQVHFANRIAQVPEASQRLSLRCTTIPHNSTSPTSSRPTVSKGAR